MSSIKLSPKHGVNPTILKCPVCWNETGEIAFLGKLAGDEEAPISTYGPVACDQCDDWMRQGIILISVRDGEAGDNPYRTGHFAVVKQEFIEKVVTNPEARAKVIEKRITYIPDAVWVGLGLPTKEVPAGEG